MAPSLRAFSYSFASKLGEVKDAREALVAGATKEEFVEAAAKAPVFSGPVDDSPALVLINAATVEPEPLEWLWLGWFPLRKLTLLTADPGVGKSTLLVDVAARITRGGPMPDGSKLARPGSVIFFCAEDGLADTVRPRLGAAGADLRRVLFCPGVCEAGSEDGSSVRTFDLERDAARLENSLAANPDCVMVVIDPITAFLGRTDAHKNADVRKVLQPLVDLAAKRGVAVVMISHLNKAAGASPLHRNMGSVAFAAVARVMLVLGKDPTDPNRRLLVRAKSNTGADQGGIAFRLVGDPEGSAGTRIVWEGSVNTTAEELLGGQTAPAECSRVERDEAKAWLGEALANGPVPSSQIKRAATEDGHSWGTIRRAKEELGVEAIKGDRWSWALPGHAPAQSQRALDRQGAQTPQGAQPVTRAHLRENKREKRSGAVKVRTSQRVSTLVSKEPDDTDSGCHAATNQVGCGDGRAVPGGGGGGCAQQPNAGGDRAGGQDLSQPALAALER
ncbi:MAG TPA: AAA family ATPase [Phycisphaerales bacterium]|nr:AAA family ATPase [Phycisphaerales bacterium]